MVFAAVFSQSQPSSSNQAAIEYLRKSGMSEAQIKSRAAGMGIDVNDPRQVSEAAKRYGVSEAYLKQRMDQNNPSQEIIKSPSEKKPIQLIDPLPETHDSIEISGDRSAEQGEQQYYGYDIFRSIPAAFQPSAVGLVDPGYILGPGDVLRLSVWGQAEFQYELQVSKEGKIYIPKVGQVFVTGLEFEKLQKKIKKILSKHYSGLVRRPPTIFMDLTVAQLKPVRIFIMGEVKRPGGYTVSSYASVFNALYSIGGPKFSGSLRNIQVFRNKKLITTVDIYDYLLKGHSKGDIRLQNNDMVFIPPRGKTVRVTGEVFRPAIYELSDTDSLTALIEYAGGVRSSSGTQRAQLIRKKSFEQRVEGEPDQVVIDLRLQDYRNGADFSLSDMDELHIFPVYQQLSNFAMLSGEVKYPGKYETKNLMLRDLVFNHGQLIDGRSYKKRVDVVRVNEDMISSRIIRIDVKDLENGNSTANLLLEPGDQVFVYKIEVNQVIDASVSIEGAIRSAGTYELSTNMTVKDLILRAGGYTEDALHTPVEVARIIPRGLKEDTLTIIKKVDFNAPLDYSPGADPGDIELQDGDKVIVRPNPEYREQQYVTVTGHAKYTGRYAIKRRNERLADVLDRAGGLMPEAFLDGSKLVRKGKPVVVDFFKAYQKRKSDENVILHPGDSIIIPSTPNAVYVHGEVNNEGLFSYLEGDDVRDYIDRAGGMTDSCHYIFLTKPNGETRKLGTGCFSGNPEVPDGSTIYVSKKPAKPPKTREGPSVGEVIKDVFAIATSAVTLIVLVVQLQNN